MPGGHEGRGGMQVKFSDNMEWWCSRPLPREDLETIPFIGEVAGVTPMACVLPEVRRRDIGSQSYGSGAPRLPTAFTDRHGLVEKSKGERSTQVATSHGNVVLTSNEQHRGFMPTADAVLFLKHEYLGSRFGAYPSRYYPAAWR
jgi:hypothetical protein